MSQPSFGRSMGALWLFTVLRFGLFFALFGLFWLIGVPALAAGLIAVVLSVPLSYVLLAKPRARLAETIEQRLAAQRERNAALNAQLKGEDDAGRG